MPNYEFHCGKCEETWEQRVPVDERDEVTHVTCGSPAVRQWAGRSVAFVGLERLQFMESQVKPTYQEEERRERLVAQVQSAQKPKPPSLTQVFNEECRKNNRPQWQVDE